jgi:hypothetical protein
MMSTKEEGLADLACGHQATQFRDTVEMAVGEGDLVHTSTRLGGTGHFRSLYDRDPQRFFAENVFAMSERKQRLFAMFGVGRADRHPIEIVAGA